MISFVNSFLSYLLLMLVILAVAGLGLVIGITLRKRKNNQTIMQVQENVEEQ